MCAPRLFPSLSLRNRSIWPLFLVFLVPALAGTTRSQTLSDDFSRYPTQSDAAPQWEAQEAGWSIAEGAYIGDDGASVWRAAPWTSAARFACDLTVLEPLSGGWLTAGIGFWVDARHYWALNLVAAPENQQRRHSTEMQEMLDGTWLAQSLPNSRLEFLPSRGSGFDWKPGETYGLEIEMTVSNILGRISRGGEEVARFGYRWKESVPAVRLGIPMLRASGLKARFDNATVTVFATATAPKPKTRSLAPWTSRPGRPLAKSTGFFRTFQADGRWWLLDPEGKPFFDVGTDHVSYRGHWCEALGYAPYHRNVAAKYGSEAAWGAETLRRLQAWGFNTLPAGHSPSLRHQGLAHIEFASFGTSFAKREWICQPIHWTGFPDVFSPRWEAHCRITARRMAETAQGDPWCIGTFLDNELEWYGKSGHLVNEVFRLPAGQAAKKAFYNWLQQRFGSLETLNRRLGTGYAQEAAFLQATNLPPASPELDQVRDAFLAVIADRYFCVAATALRQADPEHLVLGCRFAGQTPEPVLAAAGKYNDVFTINTYPQVEFENTWLPDGTGGAVVGVPRQLSDIYRATGMPMIITEWSFPALDSKLPCKHGAGMRVDTQEQKAACYRIFANTIADLPFMVGYHYFMWADEPALGISSTFPEDSNYGLVNEQDEPYPVFTQTVTGVNARAAQRHERSATSGRLTLIGLAAAAEIRNTNTIASHGHVRVIEPGRNRVEDLQLRPGGQWQFKMASEKPWCVELQQWDGSRERVLGGALRPNGFTVLNAARRELPLVPLVLEQAGTVWGTVQTLPPAGYLSLDAAPLKLEKQTSVELRGATTTWAGPGKNGALFERIESGGLALGRLVFAVHQRCQGQDAWVESTRVTELAMQEQPDAWVVEATVEHPAGSTGPAGYRARVQAVVFKQLGLAFVRPLQVQSLDTRPWQLVEAFWFCRSAIGGSTDQDIVGGPDVPGYYRRAPFITDRKQGGALGALAHSTDWQVTFWADPQGSIHPDSRLTVDQEMKPGTVWQPDPLPFLWVYATHQAEGWKTFSELSQRTKEVLVQPPAAR